MFEWLGECIAAARGTATAREEGWQFVLHPPASEEEARACEAALGIPLPPSHRAYLLRWDGAALFRLGSDAPGDFVSGGLEIAGTGELPALNARLRADRYDPPEDWGRLIVGGEAPVGEGDVWGLNPDILSDGEYAVVDGWHEQGPDRWRRAVAAPSFEAWLRRAFDEALRTGNPYYWINAPEIRAVYDACAAEDAARREAGEGRRAPTTEPSAVVFYHGEARHEARRRDDG